MFLTDFQKNTQISNLIEIHPVGAKLLNTSGHTHRQRMDGPTRRLHIILTVIFHVLPPPPDLAHNKCVTLCYPLSYGVPVRERYGSTLLPATREQHDQNCTQSD